MKADFKKAIVDNALKLVDAVNGDDYDAIANCMRFLSFSVDTLCRIHAFEENLKTPAENEKEEEK